jgi:hypothetical protein
LRTSVKSASCGNCHHLNALAPEVARHRTVHDRADFAFNSRRLHLTCSVAGPFRVASLRSRCAGMNDHVGLDKVITMPGMRTSVAAARNDDEERADPLRAQAIARALGAKLVAAGPCGSLYVAADRGPPCDSPECILPRARTRVQLSKRASRSSGGATFGRRSTMTRQGK